MKSTKRSPKIFLLGLLILAFVLVGFSLLMNKNDDKAAGGEGKRGEGGKNAKILVKVAPVKVLDMPVTIETIGNVEALETVSIQPQVSGQLKKVFFKQGDIVAQGQPLFEIDPRLQSEAVSQANATLSSSVASITQSQANVAKANAQVQVAEATLKKDEAQLTLARIQEERYRNLLAKNYVTREQYDQMNSALGTADALVLADKAAIVNARAQTSADQASVQTARSIAAGNRAVLDSNRIQLGFTRILAPVSGKTGQLLINVGNIVQPNTSTLVTIARLNPILVSFTIPEKYLLPIQQKMQKNALTIDVTVPGANAQQAKPLMEKGKLVFVDNTVDLNSGTVRLKGEFANKAKTLWPGRYVEVALQLGIEEGALVIPTQALQKGQNGDFVYVIESGRAKVRNVVVDRTVKGNVVIRKGLSADEQVVTDGQMRLAPDSPVKIARDPVTSNKNNSDKNN